jgi:hypothetical protein
VGVDAKDGNLLICKDVAEFTRDGAGLVHVDLKIAYRKTLALI